MKTSDIDLWTLHIRIYTYVYTYVYISAHSTHKRLCPLTPHTYKNDGTNKNRQFKIDWS